MTFKPEMKKILRSIISNIFIFFKKQYEQKLFENAIDIGTLIIGRYSYGQPKIHRYKGSEAKVVIGNFCSISPGVEFITGGIHPRSWVSTYPFRINWRLENAFKDGMPQTKGDIHVGSDVWTGTGAMILSGVQIGNGAIIAARAVVTKDIPDYAIAAGVPAKVIGFRFEQEIIQQLLEIEWWNWSDEKIKNNVALLSNYYIEQFLESHYMKRAE